MNEFLGKAGLVITLMMCILLVGCSGGSGSPTEPVDNEPTRGVVTPGISTWDASPEDFIYQEDGYIPPELSDPYREIQINIDGTSEPNNDAAHAVEFPIGATPSDTPSGSMNWPKVYEGSLNPSTDPVDYYKFVLPASYSIGIQLDKVGSGDSTATELRLRRGTNAWMVLYDRSESGLPKTINHLNLAANTYWIEVRNTSAATNYRLCFARGTDTDEPANDHCWSQTPAMEYLKMGTLSYGVDNFDYWRIASELNCAICLDLINFKDHNDAVIDFAPLLRRDANPSLVTPYSVTEDGNHTYADYGVYGETKLPPGFYYPGAQTTAGLGLFALRTQLYAASFWHKKYPDLVELYASHTNPGAAQVVLTNRGNVAIHWNITSTWLASDIASGYLAPGYSTRRDISIKNPTDGHWTTGQHIENFTMEVLDLSDVKKCEYTNQVKVIIVDQDYDIGWDPDPVSIDLASKTNDTIPVTITNAGTYPFRCTMQPDPASDWLSLDRDQGYLSPGYSTVVNFTADKTGYSQDQNGHADIDLYDLGWNLQQSMEIPVEMLVGGSYKDIYVKFHVTTDDGLPGGTWPMADDGHELTSTDITNDLTWANEFWNNYGINLVKVGDIHIIPDDSYYILSSMSEGDSMHSQYGTTGAVDVYFVDDLSFSSNPTAYCRMLTTHLQNHNTENVYIVSTANPYSFQSTIAHELGHEIGVLFDEYLIDPPDIICDDVQHYQLYCDDTCAYPGNLMYYDYGWPVGDYDLSGGQPDWVAWFHENYPDNF